MHIEAPANCKDKNFQKRLQNAALALVEILRIYLIL